MERLLDGSERLRKGAVVAATTPKPERRQEPAPRRARRRRRPPQAGSPGRAPRRRAAPRKASAGTGPPRPRRPTGAPGGRRGSPPAGRAHRHVRRGRHRPRAHRRRLDGPGRGRRGTPHPGHHRRAGALRGDRRQGASWGTDGCGATPAVSPGRTDVRGLPATADAPALLPRDGEHLIGPRAGQPGRHPRAGAGQGHHHRRRHQGEPARHRAADDQDPAADRLGRQGKEMGIDWWRNDPMLSSSEQGLADENREHGARHSRPGTRRTEAPGWLSRPRPGRYLFAVARGIDEQQLQDSVRRCVAPPSRWSRTGSCRPWSARRPRGLRRGGAGAQPRRPRLAGGGGTWPRRRGVRGGHPRHRRAHAPGHDLRRRRRRPAADRGRRTTRCGPPSTASRGVSSGV